MSSANKRKLTLSVEDKLIKLIIIYFNVFFNSY